MNKKYKLPERYELIIAKSEAYSNCFRIKDLQRNVTSRKFYEKSLSKLDKIISDYEDQLNLLQNVDNLNNNSDVDVILKPGSNYHLFYKGKELGSFKTLVEIINVINRIDSFESKIISLNDGEEVNL